MGKGRERRGEPETERRHRIGGGREGGSPLFIGEWRGRNFRAKIIRGGSERDGGTEGEREWASERSSERQGRLVGGVGPAERARIFA